MCICKYNMHIFITTHAHEPVAKPNDPPTTSGCFSRVHGARTKLVTEGVTEPEELSSVPCSRRVVLGWRFAFWVSHVSLFFRFWLVGRFWLVLYILYLAIVWPEMEEDPRLYHQEILLLESVKNYILYIYIDIYIYSCVQTTHSIPNKLIRLLVSIFWCVNKFPHANDCLYTFDAFFCTSQPSTFFARGALWVTY